MSESLARIIYDSVNSRVAKFIDDNGDSLLAVVGKLRNVAGTIIDPSTEGKQDDAITKLTSIDGKDFATQTTLATLATEAKLELVRALLATIDADTSALAGVDFATQTTLAAFKTAFDARDLATQTTLAAVLVDTGQIEALLATIDVDTSNLDVLLSTRATEATLLLADGRLTTIDAVLDSIKDTDGIKKITDELPAGTQDLGSIRLRDILGNGINSVLNNAIRRLEARSSITSPDGVSDVAVQSIDGVNHLSAGKTNTIDAVNSTVAQLAGAAAFAPSGTDVSQFSSVAVTVHSDQDSALNGMAFEFSQDGTNWDDVYAYNLEASTSQTRRFQFPVTAQYFRVHYTNGATLTTQLRIQTLLHRENILTSIHRVENAVKEDRSAQLVKAAIIAQREGAVIKDFYPVQADVSGNLKVTTVGSDIPSDPSAFVLRFLLNGASNDMLVNGSVTPVNFDMGPTITDEIWSIRELLLTFTADDFSFDGVSFGSIAALTNGFVVKIVKDAVPVDVFTVVQNEDFLRVPGRTPLVNNTGPKDVLGAALSFQGLVLNQSTGDLVRITINDNLTSVKLKYLTATLFAVKVL